MNSLSRMLLLVVATGAMALSIPAVASATDYCVLTSCGGTNVNTLEEALDEAKKAPDADRVFLGTGEFHAQSSFGFVYNAAGPVEIIGTSRNDTFLTAPLGATTVLNLKGGIGSSVHDLSIQMPRYANGSALYTSNTARRILVQEGQEQSQGRDGVELVNGGKLEESSVFLARDPKTAAVALGVGGGTVRDSKLVGGSGVVSRYGDGLIERSSIKSSEFGVRALRNVTTVRSTFIGSTAGTGLRADAQGASTTLNADGVSIWAAYVPDAVGVSATTALAPMQNARVKLTNSIYRGGGKALVAQSTDQGEAQVAASYSDYDPGFDTADGAHAQITEANVSYVGDSVFTAPGSADFTLPATSKLIDAGDPGTEQGVDLAGKPLVADGNGDGIARRDLGAYEREAAAGGGGTGTADTVAPVIRRFSATRARFRYILSERARVTVAIKRIAKRGGHVRLRTVGSLKRRGAEGANSIRFRARIGKRALRPGRYVAVIRATDAAGNRSKPRTAGLRIKRS